MKLWLSCALIVSTLVVAGCSKSDTPTDPSPPPTCAYTLSSTSQAPPAAGGTMSVTITRTSGSCTWAASSNASWVTLQGSASGSDTATLTFSVAPNPTTSARGGIITVSWNGGNAQIAVTQAGLGFGECVYTFPNPTQTVGSAGGSSLAALAVTGTGCSWNAASNAAWLTITSATSGTTNASIAFTVAPNPDVNPRSGTITVTHPGGSVTVTVTQEGVSTCTYTLAPTTVNAPSGGGTFSFVPTRNTPNGCSWNAATTASWITLTGPTSGLSGATVPFTVAPNAGASRTGAITITWSGGTAEVTVNQAGQ